MKDIGPKVILQLADNFADEYRLVASYKDNETKFVIERRAADALGTAMWVLTNCLSEKFLLLIVEYCLLDKLQLIMKE